MTTTAYLRRELKFTLAEWTTLSEKDKADLRQYAADEMALLGIALTATPAA